MAKSEDKKAAVKTSVPKVDVLKVELVQGNFLDVHYTNEFGYPVSDKLLPGTILTIPALQNNLDALKPFLERNLIKVQKS